ncbi:MULTISPECIES: membrane protein insertion efficiency factor YidD [Chryseobacterium]|nr:MULTISPECIES: membrane protein insertion efficiency factor YidD [Chryseobacterium]
MMKYLLIIIIKLYWSLVPPHRRRMCLFKMSCSKYVYQETLNKGFINGLKAFRYRFSNCRAGAKLIKNPINNQLQLILPNTQIIEEHEISERFIK